MPRAFLTEQLIVSENMDARHTNSSAVFKLTAVRKNTALKMGEAIDVVSEKLRNLTEELAKERERRSTVELRLQEKSAELESFEKKYAELHKGLMKVLLQKFPGESTLSLDDRLEALLLASNSGAEAGIQPDLKTNKTTTFLSLIDETL